MKTKKIIGIIAILLPLTFVSCKKKGCTDPLANNYNSKAKKDDGSCKYVTTKQTISYGSDPIQTMDLYLPAKHNQNTKVVVMVHGGGWVVGYNETDKVTTFDGRYGWDILNPLLNDGYACAVIKYRTACYVNNPADATGNTMGALNKMMEDIDLVIAYLKTNSSTLGIANNHFQLIGESAGGHIVLSYAVRNSSDPALKSVVSMFGPTTLDAYDWKNNLRILDSTYSDGILVDGINYFRTYENNCNLETNKYLKTLVELRSFGDADTVKIYQPNQYLQDISPSNPANIQNNTPMFIQHGAEDLLVPFSQADTMYSVITSIYGNGSTSDNDFSSDFKKKIYDNCGHGWVGNGCQKKQIMNDIKKWINAH